MSLSFSICRTERVPQVKSQTIRSWFQSSCLLVIGIVWPAVAADNDFTAKYQLWKSLEAQGEFAKAIPEAEAVRAIGLKQFGAAHAHIGRVLSELAGLYVECGRYKEASGTAQRAI